VSGKISAIIQAISFIQEGYLVSVFKLTEEVIDLVTSAAVNLSGSARRMFMAKVVNSLGPGGQRQSERKLGWNRQTVRKGQMELKHGPQPDNFSARGRKKAEVHLPDLLLDLEAIVAPTSQADPTFKTSHLYRPLTAEAVRQRLLDEKGYTPAELPTRRTLNTKLTQLDFRLQKVAKTEPLQKIPETDAIFEQVHQVNREADTTAGVLRLSLDTKARIKVGAFARGGQSRQGLTAFDHDFAAETTLGLFGFFLPAYAETFLFFTASKITADFMVDSLERLWPTLLARFKPHTLVLNMDCGPETNSHRTQFIKRLVEFAHTHHLTLRLAYDPPYHSKYNPIERVWGILENHWKGELLDQIEKILGLARTMTYKGIQPVVEWVEGVYETGVRLIKQEMKIYEAMIERLPGLEKWFVDIPPCAA
jgi:hypothetical protein